MDTLQELLAGRFRDPDTGLALSVPVKSVVIETSLAGREAELVSAAGIPAPFAVISDDNTCAVLGRRVEQMLATQGSVIPIRLGARPHPDDRSAARVMEQGAQAASYVAVGSGTINDLAKHAASSQRKPYCVFATAPSMNGYTSVNAAITVAGHKKSLPAAAPQAVFVDLDIMADAPQRLIRAGFGDAMCRATAQADWLLAHRLLGEPYRTAPFVLFAGLETEMMREPQAWAMGDRAAIERLVRILLLSGFGMTICGGSYPASQGEHLISHYLEMCPPQDWVEPFHGEQVAVTTLVMARLQERIAALASSPRLAASAVTADTLRRHFGEQVGTACWTDIVPKLLDSERARTLNEKLVTMWPDLQRELRAVMRPSADLDRALAAIAAPRSHADLGLTPAQLATAVQHAREIRNRYTFLDLAADSGLLDAKALLQ